MFSEPLNLQIRGSDASAKAGQGLSFTRTLSFIFVAKLLRGLSEGGQVLIPEIVGNVLTFNRLR
jgi:hypothetical protein